MENTNLNLSKSEIGEVFKMEERKKYFTMNVKGNKMTPEEFEREFSADTNFNRRSTYSQIIPSKKPHHKTPKELKAQPDLEIRFGITSIQGHRQTQEDAHRAIKASDKKNSGKNNNTEEKTENAEKEEYPFSFFGVYDGHGGQVAADFTSHHLFNLFAEEAKKSDNYPTILKKCFDKVEEDFMKKALDEGLSDGTTAVVAVIKDRKLTVANLGDSEMVISKNGKAQLLTECHNPKKNPKEKERVEALGGRIIHERVGHPRLNPNIFSIAVSRAIGDSFFKDPEVTEGKPSGLIAEPYITELTLGPEYEFLVLACDGVWDVLSYQDVVDFVKENLEKEKDPQKVSELLVQHAFNKGSTDNITALIVTLKPF